MLSKAQIKYIRSLTQQKYRKEHNVFIAEGDKICQEWLASGATVEMVVCVEGWARQNQQLIRKHPEAEVVLVNEATLGSISTLQTPNQVLLLVGIERRDRPIPTSGWVIALDTLQDPGNMGTIIRIADWFGIPDVVCAPGCVDVHNPKVVQSAMGGHIRVRIYEADLSDYLGRVTVPVVAATLAGKSMYEYKPMESAVLLIGNESKGIREELIAKATDRITIPGKGGAESLNAGVSAGILCSWLVPH